MSDNWNLPSGSNALVRPAPADSIPPADDPVLAQAPALAVDDDGWQDTAPAPWERYFARILDTTSFAFLFAVSAGVVTAFAAPALFDKLFGESGLMHNRFIDAVVTSLVAIPILAALIGMAGTTPGKWLMGVRVTRRDGKPIGFKAGLQREWKVALRGMGLGIPFVSLFTLATAHKRLTTEGSTSWDEGADWVVTHRPRGTVKYVLGAIGILAAISIRVALHFL